MDRDSNYNFSAPGDYEMNRHPALPILTLTLTFFQITRMGERHGRLDDFALSAAFDDATRTAPMAHAAHFSLHTRHGPTLHASLAQSPTLVSFPASVTFIFDLPHPLPAVFPRGWLAAYNAVFARLLVLRRVALALDDLWSQLSAAARVVETERSRTRTRSRTRSSSRSRNQDNLVEDGDYHGAEYTQAVAAVGDRLRWLLAFRSKAGHVVATLREHALRGPLAVARKTTTTYTTTATTTGTISGTGTRRTTKMNSSTLPIHPPEEQHRDVLSLLQAHADYVQIIARAPVALGDLTTIRGTEEDVDDATGDHHHPEAGAGQKREHLLGWGEHVPGMGGGAGRPLSTADAHARSVLQAALDVCMAVRRARGGGGVGIPSGTRGGDLNDDGASALAEGLVQARKWEGIKQAVARHESRNRQLMHALQVDGDEESMLLLRCLVC